MDLFWKSFWKFGWNSLLSCFRFIMSVRLWFPIGNSSTISYVRSNDNLSYIIQILAPCNYCHHPWCVGHKSYHIALLIMFGCDGISDHASWNEVFHYWDTKLSWWYVRWIPNGKSQSNVHNKSKAIQQAVMDWFWYKLGLSVFNT